MSTNPGWVILAGAATLVDGLLAGASLDQSVKQLPARHRIGMLAFSAYSRASDQATGLFWYVPLGIGGALLTVVAAIWAVAVGLPSTQTLAAVVAGGLAIAHSVTTARAAPINWSQRRVAGDEEALALVFRRFERWQTARAILQLGSFLAMVSALATVAFG